MHESWKICHDRKRWNEVQELRSPSRLDKSNYLAEARGILIHSAGKVTRFSGEKEYIPLGTESRGCFTVSRSCVEKVMQIYKESSRRRPVLIYAKYK